MPPTRELATLTALAQALSRPAGLAESLDAALATVAQALGLETGWVWLLEEGSDEPRLAAARALPRVLQSHPEAMHGDCYCLKTFRSGDLRGAANVNVVWCSRLAQVAETAGQRDGGTAVGTAVGTELRCHASVPLTAGARHLGMLNVASSDWRVLSPDELNLLTTAGALVSLAVERSRLRAAEERNRLAREIHDTIAQSLAALTMQLEAVDARAGAAGDPHLRESAARALTLSRATLEEARRSVLELRAAPLEGRSLPEALERLAAEASAGAGAPRIAVRTELGANGAGELPTAVEVGLYRIAQQAVANLVGHARAGSALVRLIREPGRLRLRIEDDGVGFDPSSVPAGRFGLVGMSERARLLGGTLTVESAPGAGTAIDVAVPLTAAGAGG
jgi:two-component system, NarL family, sensor kinase